ncbi:TonB-dependent receptor, partial [Klebsiella pneumoniae]|uniref:TonB-dependent receptor n=1 Tax=Klebsiella pneumoniae TaxID=573 RepID=UPI0025A2E22E
TSVGLSGSDLFGHDLDRQTFGVTGANYWFGSGNTVSTGLKEGDLPVVDLRAEKSRKFDFGVDIGLWNKLYLSMNYFNEQRSNILVNGA